MVDVVAVQEQEEGTFPSRAQPGQGGVEHLFHPAGLRGEKHIKSLVKPETRVHEAATGKAPCVVPCIVEDLCNCYCRVGECVNMVLPCELWMNPDSV